MRCMAEGDPLKPHVVSRLEVTEPGADGGYEPGDRVRVAVTFNEAVVVDASGGTPTIGLNLGDGREFVTRAAPYLDGSGTKRLGFEYRVVATDGEFEVLEVAGDSLATNGGTIRNAQGLDAILTHGWAAEPFERFLQPAQLSVSDVTAQEGSPVVFEVSLSRSASNAVSVDYRTADETATAGADYEAASGTLSFAPGEMAKSVSVATLDDAHDEGEETLTPGAIRCPGRANRRRQRDGQDRELRSAASGVAGAVRQDSRGQCGGGDRRSAARRTHGAFVHLLQTAGRPGRERRRTG